LLRRRRSLRPPRRPRRCRHPARSLSPATASPPKSAAESPRTPCVHATDGNNAESSSLRPDRNFNLIGISGGQAVLGRALHSYARFLSNRRPKLVSPFRRRCHVNSVCRYQIHFRDLRPELHWLPSRFFGWLGEKG